MNEATKSKAYWGELEQAVLSGKGIDIGCGPDPVTPDARRFDLEDGDANRVTDYIQDQFDFVFSSHCLEHMHDPKIALQGWWKLVKPGGFLFFIVPDEDLYEQGVFPSRFNADHKATFTICKVKSWSRVSCNVFELANNLPNSKIIKIALQDHGYDRNKYTFGTREIPIYKKILFKCHNIIKKNFDITSKIIDQEIQKYFGFDQTRYSAALAQIECIVQKSEYEPMPVFRQQFSINI